MNYKIFTVYDSKVESFLPPFYMKSKGEAIRSFTEVCNDEKSNFSKYPGDYTLFELGSWNEANAEFVLHKSPVSLGLALEFARVAPSSS